MQAIFSEEQQVRPADIVLAEDCIDVEEKLTEIMLIDVRPQNRVQRADDIGMIGNRAWAHGDFSMDQLQPHARRILAKLQKLPCGHFYGADGHGD